MSASPSNEVRLSVGGRSYTVACAPGEEERVRSLGDEIDGKLSSLGGNLAPQEAQNLLFAALLLADDLREARSIIETREGRLDELTAQVAQLQEAARGRDGEIEALRAEAQAGGTPTGAGANTADPDLAPALEKFAAMLEDCADKLEGKAPST